jgi:trans-aconitate methyltransferase
MYPVEYRTSQEFFERLYRKSEDPWNFSSSVYEASRYQEILNALPQKYFERAFEPGCSIGVLTEKLAARCSEIQAIDISITAVRKAQQRCQNLLGVHINPGILPTDIPDGVYDLIVFSEIGYYFSIVNLQRIIERLVNQLSSRGTLIGVHWLGKSPDHVLDGNVVNDTIGSTDGLELTLSKRSEQYRLDRWTRC